MSAIEDPGVMSPEEKILRFGEGPWVSEPDRVEFNHMGLPCLITRHPDMGNLCGYVAVPPGHPWHGKADPPVYVHGGCNYASLCLDRICHTPDPGEPDNVWWFGFDCGHGFDMAPVMTTGPLAKVFRSMNREYRDFAYVQTHVKFLAEQLHALGQP